MMRNREAKDNRLQTVTANRKPQGESSLKKVNWR
jgi:hypothetical protein